MIFFVNKFKNKKNKDFLTVFATYVQKKEHIIEKNCLTIHKNHGNNELLGIVNSDKLRLIYVFDTAYLTVLLIV